MANGLAPRDPRWETAKAHRATGRRRRGQVSAVRGRSQLGEHAVEPPFAVSLGCPGLELARGGLSCDRADHSELFWS